MLIRKATISVLRINDADAVKVHSSLIEVAATAKSLVYLNCSHHAPP